jgi:hypothetical protein
MLLGSPGSREMKEELGRKKGAHRDCSYTLAWYVLVLSAKDEIESAWQSIMKSVCQRSGQVSGRATFESMPSSG